MRLTGFLKDEPPPSQDGIYRARRHLVAPERVEPQPGHRLFLENKLTIFFNTSLLTRQTSFLGITLYSICRF